MKTICIILLFLSNSKMMAQSTFQGEFYFRRQEMVAGFKFSADGRFDFFYSYGASDRNATGTFTIEGDTLKLKSDKEVGNDFTVDTQSKVDSGYVIKCHAPNQHLLPYMQCIAFVGDKPEVFEANNEGVIHIDLPHCDKIYVSHSIFVDVPTLIKDEKNENNRFSCTIKPIIQQVSFKGIDFKIVDDKTITCFTNYFMPVADIEFIKN